MPAPPRRRADIQPPAAARGQAAGRDETTEGVGPVSAPCSTGKGAVVHSDRAGGRTLGEAPTNRCPNRTRGRTGEHALAPERTPRGSHRKGCGNGLDSVTWLSTASRRTTSVHGSRSCASGRHWRSLHGVRVSPRSAQPCRRGRRLEPSRWAWSCPFRHCSRTRPSLPQQRGSNHGKHEVEEPAIDHVHGRVSTPCRRPEHGGRQDPATRPAGAQSGL